MEGHYGSHYEYSLRCGPLGRSMTHKKGTYFGFSKKYRSNFCAGISDIVCISAKFAFSYHVKTWKRVALKYEFIKELTRLCHKIIEDGDHVSSQCYTLYELLVKFYFSSCNNFFYKNANVADFSPSLLEASRYCGLL